MSDQVEQSKLALTPTLGITATDTLATSMHASPGLYAVLLGAGMSLSAGQMGAWDILCDLISKVAKSHGDDLENLQESPEEWWTRTTGEEPGYGVVLERLGSTPGARQQLLQSYFEPTKDGQDVSASLAHQHLADLCATGRIKVIITTNFDRVIEQALSARGVKFQVLGPKDISTMIPLVHAPVTVIKVHGNYQSLDIRNTAQELAKYARPLARLLREIFTDFGLIVIGWSGKWDSALRDLIQRNASRKYPMYWVDYNGQYSEEATQLVQNRQAYTLSSRGADQFLEDLWQRINRLDQISVRKERPTFLRSIRYAPFSFAILPDSPPPLLLLRTAVTLGPANIDESDLISLEERRKILAALDNHHLSGQLRDFAISGDLFGQLAQPVRANASGWEVSKADGPPTGDSVAFRLNLDRGGYREKVFGRLEVQSPANGYIGNNFLTLLDVGITVSRKLTISEMAAVWKGSLELLTNDVPEMLTDALPRDAVPNLAELYIVRPEHNDGTGGHPNDLEEYVDLAPWGEVTRRPGGGLDRLDAAVMLNGPLTTKDAGNLLVKAIERMALNHGYGNFEKSIQKLRLEMSIASPK